MNMAARLLKDPATANSRIFVGHLQTEEMTRTELEDHFSKYGTIVGSLLNRGFGFVQFENEQDAQNAIKNENGAMFKGRRIDVKPAKKDGPGGGGGGGGGPGGPAGNAGGGFGNDSFNNSFGGGNQSFNNSNSFGNDNQFNRGGGPSGPGGPGGPFNDQDDFNNRNDSFNSKGNGPSFGGPGGPSGPAGPNGPSGPGGPGNPGGPAGPGNRGGPGNQNQNQNKNNRGRGSRGGKNRRNREAMNNRMDDPFNDRMGGGMGDRGDMGDGMGGGMGDSGRNLGSGLGSSFRSTSVMVSGLGASMGSSLGGGLGSSFRDRSPLGRPGRFDDKPSTLANWELNKPMGGPGGPGGRGGYGNFNDRKSRFDDFKGPGPMHGEGPGYGPSSSGDYPPMVPEKNDCEIIVVNKLLTDYAEMIESRLKKMGLTVDLLFPNEDVPLTRVLGNIASRGCLYAIVVTALNKEHHSLTLNILHGLPQEHRNMPVEDAVSLILRDYKNYKSGGRSVPANAPPAHDRHPDAIQVLLNMLADNLQLTVLQYEGVIKYLKMRREEQVQIELGEDLKSLSSPPLVRDPEESLLQSRILNILNSKPKNPASSAPSMVEATPSPVPPPSSVTANAPGNSASAMSANPVTPSPLLSNPTVQKALDSLFQGNLLKNIGENQQQQQQPSNSPASGPLFAAFPTNRF